MIAGIHGQVRARGDDHLVVGVGGFDLRIFLSTNGLAKAGSVGDGVDLWTHLYIRDDVLALYGFTEHNELRMFEQLLTVSGVGPRLALTLLSAHAPDTLRAAIAREDAVALSRAPGVGRKLAGRIILELRSAMDRDTGLETSPARPLPNDLLDALQGLGMTASEAQAMAQHVDVAAAESVEEQIKRALQHYATRRY